MRSLLLFVLLAAVCPTPAHAEDAVVLDEWSAVFESGSKLAWEHEVIRIQHDPAAGTTECARTHTRWTPVDTEVVVEREHEVTDGTGRVRWIKRTREGPRGRYAISFRGDAYEVAIRKLKPRTGKVTVAVYSMPVMRALIIQGTLKAGEHTVNTLDVFGDGFAETTFQLTKTPKGLWRFAEDGRVTLRDRHGVLIRATAPEKQPHFLQVPTTEAKAVDRSIKDPTARPAKGLRHIQVKTAMLKAPEGAWRQLRKEGPTVVMAGMEHALGVLIAVMELPVPMGTSEKERLGLAAGIRKGFNDRGALPTFGEPVLATFKDKPAVAFPLSGEMKTEPIEGRAWLVRNPEGEALVVFGFHAIDMRELCAPLLARGLEGVHLDATGAGEGSWTRVHSQGGGLTFTVPPGWKKDRARERWLAPGGASQVAINTGTLPAGMDMATAQAKWADSLRGNPAIKDPQLTKAVSVDVDGVSMVRTSLTALVTQGEGKPDLAIHAISTGRHRADQTFIEVVVVAFDDLAAAEVQRMLASIRWTTAPVKKADAPK